MTEDIASQGDGADSTIAGRIALLCRAGRHPLTLLFAILCLAGGLLLLWDHPRSGAILLAAGLLAGCCKAAARLLDDSLRLRHQNRDLVATLAREKAQALAAQDSARASALAKASFVANISHELRTPLNALLGMAQLLERADLPKQQGDHVKVMLQAGMGLQTLIDDVIALTRDDDDQLEDEDCDPVQAARAVARLLQPRAWEKQLHLTLSAASGLPRVAADPRKVRQVLLKLADNALKFTEHGLIDIRLDLSEDRHAVRFCLSDTGHGVAPQVAHLLFAPFSPGDVSYARKEQGAGLGLAVAKRVVEQAGGKIGFESRPGEGAQFWFTLPVSGVAQSPAAARSDVEAQHAAPTGLSLLVFLRNAEVRDGVTRLLEPFGNRIVEADNMADAIARAGRDEFDAIIAGAGDADMLAAAPGVKAPLVAVLLRGDRAPHVTDAVLRWPVEADQLYRALDEVCEPEGVTQPEEIPAAIDPVAFSALEKSVGVTTLVEVLQCYITTAEQLTTALSEACGEEKWDDATRLAQDIVGAAGGLGLMAMTQAAREFMACARQNHDRHALRNAAQMVVGEHVRAKQALIHLYPDVA